MFTRIRRPSTCFVLAFTCALALLVAGAPAGAQPTAPNITGLTPQQGPVGTPVFIQGTNFGNLLPTSVVTFNGVVVDMTLTYWSDTLIVTRVPQGASTGNVVVFTLIGGPSNGVPFTVTETPTPPVPPANQTWYLAEGSSAYGFETFILMANTTDVTATVNITYNTQQYGRIPRPQSIAVPPASRVTLNMNSDLPNVDASTTVSSDQPIVCERAMYWNGRAEGTDSIGTMEPSTTWYLAEGCTSGGYETWLMVQNPGTTQTATVNVTYMTSNGVVNKPPFNLGPGLRTTIQVSADVGACDVSAKVTSNNPIVCERSMYWDGRRGGHDSIGVSAGSTTWYLSEGSTTQGFQTWLLLQNPTDKVADVDVTWMTRLGPKVQPTFQMQPNSRLSIPASSQVPADETSIEVKSNQEIIAERSMYWDNGTGKAGHETVAAPVPAFTIYLAEGCTNGFETFVCIQNPDVNEAHVQVTYQTPNGALAGIPRTIAPQSRMTLNVGLEVPDSDVSVKLVSDVPIMAERAMYWNGRGAGHDSIGWMDTTPPTQ